MKIAIVDDEEDVRYNLLHLLKKAVPGAKIVQAGGVVEAAEMINHFEPDVVFLDVMLADGTGFDLLKRIGQVNFKVIFCSGYDTFAIKAFRFSAIDYLLKPVVEEELREALEKADQLSRPHEHRQIETLHFNLDKTNLKNRRLVLKDAVNIYFVEIDQIIRCQSSDNYTTFYIVDHKPVLISRPLKEFEALLDAHDFARVHQSHLINLNYLVQLSKTDGDVAILKDGSQVPVSGRKKELLLNRLMR